MTTLSSSGRQGTFSPPSSLRFSLIRIRFIYEDFAWIKAGVTFKSSWKIETHLLISRWECLEARGKHRRAVAHLTNWGPEANIFMGSSTSALPRFNFKLFSTIFKDWKSERTWSNWLHAISIVIFLRCAQIRSIMNEPVTLFNHLTSFYFPLLK